MTKRATIAALAVLMWQPAGSAWAAAPTAIAAPGLSPTGDASSTTSLVPGAQVPLAAAKRALQSVTLDEFVSPTDPVNDYTNAWNRAFAASPTVRLLPHPLPVPAWGSTYSQYRIASTVTIPQYGKLFCDGSLMGFGNPLNWNTMPYTIRTPAASTVQVAGAGAWKGCNQVADNYTLTPASTYRQIMDAVTAFAGTGITALSYNSDIEDAFIGGFATDISAQSSAQTHWRNLNLDGTACVSMGNSHDISHLYSIHCHPFMTAITAVSVQSFAVSAVANNGSGLYRLTVADTSAIPLKTGDTVYVAGLVGATSANNKWVATVVDATHIDLQGSSATGVSVSGTTFNNSRVLQLASVANVGLGDTVTGTNVQAGTTVSQIIQGPGFIGVIVSQKLTGNGTGTYTFADAAYASGGTLNTDVGQRSGYGYDFTNSETINCEFCFANLHTVGFHAGAGMAWLQLSMPSCDSTLQLADPTSICLLIDSTSKGTAVIGGQFQAIGRPVVINNTGSDPNTIQGLTINSNGTRPVIEVDNGLTTLIGNGSGAAAGVNYLFMADAATSLVDIGSNMKNTFMPQSTIARGRYQGIGQNTAPGSYSGTQAFAGQLEVGGQGCGDTLSNCFFGLKGAFYDEDFQPLTMTNGGTDAVSGAIHTTAFLAAATIPAYTIQMPSLTNYQELNFYFQQAVTTLTISGGTTSGLPTSPAANSWHKCVGSSSAGAWLCN